MQIWCKCGGDTAALGCTLQQLDVGAQNIVIAWNTWAQVT